MNNHIDCLEKEPPTVYVLNRVMKLCVPVTIAALSPAGPEVIKQQEGIWVLVGVNFAYVPSLAARTSYLTACDGAKRDR